MRTTAARGRSERREEIRDQLLAIVESLVESGENYLSISVERLAAEAGMSRTRFYMYFEDKGDLLQAWARKLGDEAQTIFQEWWEQPQPISRDDLRAILRRYVALCQQHHTLLTAIQDATAVDPRIRALVDTMIGEHIAALGSFIERGQREGWAVPGLDPHGLAAWIGWLRERGVLQVVGQTSPRHIRHVVDSYVAIVWKSLYRVTPDPQAARRS